ncbi:MAG: AI-2E family transporter [Peptostreptococcaceae bacterium]|nr:AI-2E family transporter [Peptostreptococcaceae bacterium]
MSGEPGIDIDNKEKVISLIVLSLILITFWSMMDLVLLTFILCFVFYSLLILIQKKMVSIFKFKIPDGIILIVLYIISIIMLVIGSAVFLPKVIAQFGELANIFFNVDIDEVKKAIGPRLVSIVSQIDFNAYLDKAGSLVALIVTKIGYFSISLFMSIILSFIILMEKNKINIFGRNMAKSKLSFMYEYFRYFGRSFAQTFGKVMKVQITIAAINSILSMVVLSILGFPGILGLGTMIFVLGLIPVAGVVISLIPLSAIAFSIGGVIQVLQVLVMIIILHGIETYVLNPKLMSARTRLPVCFVFIILLVAEHYLGIWGLLIGVPIFIFLMSIFKVEYKSESSKTNENAIEQK